MILDLTHITPEKRAPKVGEIWKHSGQSTLFIRIDDEKGRRAIGFPKEAEVFFSLSLSVDPGRMVYTSPSFPDVHVYGELETVDKND